VALKIFGCESKRRGREARRTGFLADTATNGPPFGSRKTEERGRVRLAENAPIPYRGWGGGVEIMGMEGLLGESVAIWRAAPYLYLAGHAEKRSQQRGRREEVGANWKVLAKERRRLGS